MYQEKLCDFERRIHKYDDELRWLYMELYDNDSMYGELCSRMYEFFKDRNDKLKKRDKEREENPDWYIKNNILGMMLYIDNFGETLEGVTRHLDYLEKCNVNMVHLMPFLDTPKERSDGGYAVSDFCKVKEEFGNIEDLKDLTEKCHDKKMNVCMDFILNHTSEEHEWAIKARQGDGEYMSRYFFFDNEHIPKLYEQTVPQVFPTTAPGNFTWVPENGHYVLTTFYPYQWDLNYQNPRVFNEMIYNFLYLANCGIDIMRVDAVPYIWKELGTQCRNLKQVHTIVRMIRMICEIVCPSVLLLGEVVMEPEKVVPYFGTLEKPECHLLYNVTTMATTWHTLACKDVQLLKQQLDIVNKMPKEYVFLNYLRCHDDIGWGLDYESLKKEGIDERAHKEYLNNYFQGYVFGSLSRGELYNADPVTGDARFCGTTASMCGIEHSVSEGNKENMELSIQLDIMLHACMFMQTGIPMIYSGDEIAQLNDYTYKNFPEKIVDSRYLHRGKFNWDAVKNIEKTGSLEEKIFSRLDALEKIRKKEPIFNNEAETHTLEIDDKSILGISRTYQGEEGIGLFNFSDMEKQIVIDVEKLKYKNLLNDKIMEINEVILPPYGFCIFCSIK